MQIRDRKDWWAASIPLALLTVLAAVLAGTAWLCDDAYISLRVADNWANGYGLRWNVDERVQVFTHPLWLILLAIGRLLSGEVYYSSLLLSIALSLLAAAAAFALARTTATGMLAIGLLLSSRAWTDFSTSGLENPLIHLLLAFHVWGYTRTTGRQRLLLQTLSASLLATTRMDALLLALPSLLAATVGVPRRQVARMLFLGAAPFLLWELFSLIYYGALFPNTAYAKLGSGIPRAQLVIQGCFYLVDSLRRDPLTLAVITTVAVHAIWRSPQLRPLAAGMVVYLLYVVVVGGDFMSGRLLTPVLFLAVLLLAAQTVLGTPLRRWAVVASLLVCNALVYLAPRDGGWFHGIADERSYYFPHTGLIRALSGDNVPDHPWVDKGRACNAAISKEGTTTPTVFMDGAALQDRAGKGGALMIEHNVGMLGYFAGPAVHIVDVLALTDPMLARLPAYEDSSWRVGHYQRILPTGYITTLLTDENHFGDTSVAHLYSTLRERTQGEIFSWSRARQIVASVLGIDTQPIDFESYRRPSMLARARSWAEARPMSAERQINHATALLENGQQEEAFQRLDWVSGMSTNDWPYQFMIARTYANFGLEQRARTVYQHALRQGDEWVRTAEAADDSAAAGSIRLMLGFARTYLRKGAIDGAIVRRPPGPALQ